MTDREALIETVRQMRLDIVEHRLFRLFEHYPEAHITKPNHLSDDEIITVALEREVAFSRKILKQLQENKIA